MRIAILFMQFCETNFTQPEKCLHTHTPEKITKIGILSNTGPDPLINQKATKPVFNVGPSSARQRNAI